MELQQILSGSLNTFLEGKQKEILAFAQKNTEEVVKTEMALMDFELLLAANSKKGESEKLGKLSRELRNESWNNLSKRFDGNYDKISDFIEKF